MAIESHVLPNGLRILIEHVGHVQSASIGLWCQAGGADETEAEAGIAHFIEHMMFKGTAKRTAKQIAETIEGRGGILNAFTDKQQTCYYCRVLADDSETGVDVLADMLTGSLLQPDEVNRERGVILEEIKRSEDEPDDQVHDFHYADFWPSHPLGRPIIGTRESVSGFSADDFRRFQKRHYGANRVVLACAGNVVPDKAFRWAEDRLGGLTASEPVVKRPPPTIQPGDRYYAKESEQVHFVIGATGLAAKDPELHTIFVLDGLLGSGMSSRLFQEIRETRGLAYSIGSFTSSYEEAGLFAIYGGTGTATWAELQSVVHEQLALMVERGPEDEELKRVKRTIAGNIALGLESMNSRMMRMARNELTFGRDIPVEETLRKIDAVTADDVKKLAARIFAPGTLRTTAIGPKLA